MLRLLLCWFVLLLTVPSFQAQELVYREGQIPSPGDTLFTDSLLIYPKSIRLYAGDSLLPSSAFRYDSHCGCVLLLEEVSDSLRYSYTCLDIPQRLVMQTRDTSQIYERFKGDRELFLQRNTGSNQDLFGGSQLRKSGAISRGITFGNNQNLGVNSSLNLELSGMIGDDLELTAVLTDDNLPIQPEGNTSQLQEFDQVFVQLANKRMKLIAGDFWLRKPETGYFLTYQKRAQGLYFEQQTRIDSMRMWSSKTGLALSRGKFNRQIIQGVEGNQGPYRLVGAENEPFIIVLSGSEKVFIDGKLLQRGQAFDYVIDYNTAEVTFTSRQLITKDSRIVIEFQYSDQNYARSVVQNSLEYSGKRTQGWIHFYNEQDSKNQSLQQQLSQSQKNVLGNAGDDLQAMRASSIDSIGYQENQVMYELRDSLGFDSVLVVSVNQQKATYRAVFQFVGPGNGDYVFDQFNALGRVYRWVAPVNGQSQGDYAPSRLLTPPEQRRMVSAGLEQKLGKRWTVSNEMSVSTFDKNTFSRLDAGDDRGWANYFEVNGRFPLGDSAKKRELILRGSNETRDVYFQPIQQYRAVEFDRDWNIRGKDYRGQQLYSTAGFDIAQRQQGKGGIALQHFKFGDDFQGLRVNSEGRWQKKGTMVNWTASRLESEALVRNDYTRHKVHLEQKIGPLKLGFIDDHEQNRFGDTLLNLSTNSYQFYDYQFYLSNADTSKTNFRIFYRERFDRISDSNQLAPAAKGTSFGIDWRTTSFKNQLLHVVGSYRKLEIKNAQLLPLTPEDNILGRVEYQLRAWKGALRFQNFYESASGLEQRREFLYIQVNNGQGIYTWIDYNGDGVKDLNEFEVAQFTDQANYIRVFTPSNQYQKTFSNELNQSIFWQPERLWSNEKGLRKVLSYFSNQARIRLARKTTGLDGLDAFVPVESNVRDTTLISTSSSFRNSLFFNRTSNVFNMEYRIQNSQSKNLLANGFDARANNYQELAPQWNVRKDILLSVIYQRGQKISAADYTQNRNFDIQYFFVQPEVAFQPNTKFRIGLNGKYTEKTNAFAFGGEKAFLSEIGIDTKWNRAKKGSLQAQVKAVRIAYNGVANSALGFEMLEALQVGQNYTWTFGYQRSLSENLQLSIQYNGRQSEGKRTIHSGGMEVRAFF